MLKGRVLIVEADEWVTTLVRRFLSDASYRTEVAATAREGFEQAVRTQPDLLLVDVALPDIDGFWVTKRVRAEKGKLATTPIILISQCEDSYARLEGLNFGADVFLSAPFRHEEVTAQVAALMGMARRLSGKRDSLQQDSVLLSMSAALQGDIAQISIPTLLSMLEMERRTGKVRVRGPNNTAAVIELEDGAVTRTELDKRESPALAVFRIVVTWTSGNYAFDSTDNQVSSQPKMPITLLLLEAMRLNDEAKR